MMPAHKFKLINRSHPDFFILEPALSGANELKIRMFVVNLIIPTLF